LGIIGQIQISSTSLSGMHLKFRRPSSGDWCHSFESQLENFGVREMGLDLHFLSDGERK